MTTLKRTMCVNIQNYKIIEKWKSQGFLPFMVFGGSTYLAITEFPHAASEDCVNCRRWVGKLVWGRHFLLKAVDI